MGYESYIDHLPPSIMVKGLKDIHPWPLLRETLSIYKNKVKRYLALFAFLFLLDQVSGE